MFREGELRKECTSGQGGDGAGGWELKAAPVLCFLSFAGLISYASQKRGIKAPSLARMCHQASSLRQWLLSQAQQDPPLSLCPVAFWLVPGWLLPDSGESSLTWFSWGPGVLGSWAHASCSRLLERPFCSKTPSGKLWGNQSLPPVLFRVALGAGAACGALAAPGDRVRKRAEHLGYVVSAPREAGGDNPLTGGYRVLAGCWGAGREEGRENSFHHLKGCLSSILKPCYLFGHFRGCVGIK